MKSPLEQIKEAEDEAVRQVERMGRQFGHGAHTENYYCANECWKVIQRLGEKATAQHCLDAIVARQAWYSERGRGPHPSKAAPFHHGSG